MYGMKPAAQKVKPKIDNIFGLIVPEFIRKIGGNKRNLLKIKEAKTQLDIKKER